MIAWLFLESETEEKTGFQKGKYYIRITFIKIHWQKAKSDLIKVFRC